MIFKKITDSSTETKKLGGFLAREILKNRLNGRAVVFALTGNLGGGKTTFAQGLAKGLEIKEKILSPTFVVMRRFKIRENSRRNSRRFKNLYHFDCYRIKNSREILELGFKNILSDKSSIVIVEWADKIKKIIPKNSVWINFKFINKNKREIMINCKSSIGVDTPFHQKI